MRMSPHYVVIKCRALTMLLKDSTTVQTLCKRDHAEALRQVVGSALCQARDAVYQHKLDAVPATRPRELMRVRREIRFNNQDFNRAEREIIQQLRDKYK